MLPFLRAMAMRVRGWIFRERVDEEFSAELETHLEMLTAENVRRGMSPEVARREARIRLGGTTQLREVHRELNSFPRMDTLLQDIRYAVRGLRRNPGFAAVAVFTLALGIGINATMFSMVSAILLRRPPGNDPDRVAVISTVNPDQGLFHADAYPVSAPNFLAWRRENHVFTDMAAVDVYRKVSLTGQEQPEEISAEAITPNYLSVLGASPLLGRSFADGEDQPGRDHVVLLSQELWERRFGSDPNITGHTIRLDRENYVVIGVMSKEFLLLGYTPRLWIPLVLKETDQTDEARKNRSLRVFGRLKPEATVEQASAEFTALGQRAAESFPEAEKGWGIAVRALPEFLIYDFGIRAGLAVIMTTVGFVLLIACANVAGLLLARGAGRRKEMGIRISLGATRLWIMRQLLTEGLVIALLGGSLGLLVAYWGIDVVRANMNFNEAMSAVPIVLDWNVVAFTMIASVVSAMLCSLAPAVAASRYDVQENLGEGNRGSSGGRRQSRMRTLLVTGELASALFLLIGTGLLLRGIYLIEHQKLGFRQDHLLTASVALDHARYKDGMKQSLFVKDLMDRLQQVPGAESAAATSDLPATGADRVTLRIKGQPELSANNRQSALDVVVTNDYFRTAGIPLLRGRTFTETDGAPAPRVVVVNQEFVHRILQDQEALGKQILLDVSGSTPEWCEIVGVVSNVKSYSETTRDDPQVYEAFLQRPVSSFSIMVRSNSDPEELAPLLRNTVSQMDAELPLGHLESMTALIERQKGGDAFFSRVLVSFALLALLLASIGIYGLVAYSVNQRTREVGIRMALGAGSSDVLRMVLRDGIRMTLIGAAIGLMLALPLPIVFDAIFYGLHLREPLLYLIVPIALVLVGALATYIPARRAARVDPMVALRYE
jgi:predicted permease